MVQSIEKNTMKITKANKKEKEEAIKIAKQLPEWFNKEGILSLKIDFKMNHVAVCKIEDKMIGFLCYTSYGRRMLIMWFGIRKNYQRKNYGKKMLDWLEKESKKLDLKYLELETLPKRYNYPPYETTRNFYYKNGFKQTNYRKASIPGWDDQIILEKKIQ